jgi:hypothetical protein
MPRIDREPPNLYLSVYFHMEILYPGGPSMRGPVVERRRAIDVMTPANVDTHAMSIALKPPERPYRTFESRSAPPSDPLRFVIARDASNQWIVMETHGLYGGVFVSKEAAVRFADFECGGRKATVEVIGERGNALEFGNDNG